MIVRASLTFLSNCVLTRCAAVLRIVAADIESHVKSQRLKFRIRITGIRQLTLKEIHKLRIQFQLFTDLIIELIEVPDIIRIGALLESVVALQFIGNGFYLTELIDIILVRIA